MVGKILNHQRGERSLLSISVFSLICLMLFQNVRAQAVCGDDGWTSGTLEGMIGADWLLPRSYDLIVDPLERHDKMLDDFTFEARIAKKAQEAGVELNQGDLKIIATRSEQLIKEAGKKKQFQLTPIPTDEQVERFADERGWNLPIPERYTISYIRFSKKGLNSDGELKEKQELADLVALDLTVEDFSNQARLWSEAPSSLKGGSLGSISPDDLGPLFLSQVQRVEPGTIGGPFETPTGWNILWVQNHVLERVKFTLEEKQQMTREILAQQVELSGDDLEEIVLSVEACEELKALKNSRLTRNYLHERFGSLAQEPMESELRELYKKLRSQILHPRRWKGRELQLAFPQWSSEVSVKEKWAQQMVLRDQARELREQVLQEEITFEEAARLHSDSATASTGGDLGWITEPSNAFVDRAFGRLEPVQVSVPLATKNGMVLFYLEADNSNERQMTFEECRDQLVNSWKRSQFADFHQKLRHEVE